MYSSDEFLRRAEAHHQTADATSFTNKEDFEWYLRHHSNPVQLFERCADHIENQSYFNQNFKDTYLHNAIIRNNTEIANYFLSKGAEIDSRINGKSLIQKAIDEKNGPMFIRLLAAGATIPDGVVVDFVSKYSINQVHHTPLFYLVSAVIDNYTKTPSRMVDEAQFSRLRQVIEKLIDAGADMHYKKDNGESPYDLAQAHPEATSLLPAGFDAGEAQVSTYAAVPEANIAASASNDKYATIMPILMFGVGLCIGLSAYYFIGLSALLSVGVALLGFAVVGVVDSLCRPCLSVKGTSLKSAFSFQGVGRMVAHRDGPTYLYSCKDNAARQSDMKATP